MAECKSLFRFEQEYYCRVRAVERRQRHAHHRAARVQRQRVLRLALEEALKSLHGLLDDVKTVKAIRIWAHHERLAYDGVDRKKRKRASGAGFLDCEGHAMEIPHFAKCGIEGSRKQGQTMSCAEAAAFARHSSLRPKV